MFGLLIFLLIGAIAGWLASKLVRGSGMGFWANMGLGVVGALVGGFVFEQLGIAIRPLGFFSSFIGAVIVLALANLIARK